MTTQSFYRSLLRSFLMAIGEEIVEERRLSKAVDFVTKSGAVTSLIVPDNEDGDYAVEFGDFDSSKRGAILYGIDSDTRNRVLVFGYGLSKEAIVLSKHLTAIGIYALPVNLSAMPYSIWYRVLELHRPYCKAAVIVGRATEFNEGPLAPRLLGILQGYLGPGRTVIATQVGAALEPDVLALTERRLSFDKRSLESFVYELIDSIDDCFDWKPMGIFDDLFCGGS